MSDRNRGENTLKQRKANIARIIQESQVVDFNKLGEAVTRLGPELEAGLTADDFLDEVATDYIIWGYGSVVHAYHNLEATQGLEVLKNIANMQKVIDG